ncbi:MAG: nickel-dependent lactate racemase [Dehalococcoidia bacterium]|nr:nickel-dependent lactate racemase [Dehalococcoidia bacterium]
MKVHLAYGEHGLDVELPDDAVVLEPKRVASLPDPERSVAEAVERPFGSPPLRQLLHSGHSMAIVVSDVTRPVPNRVLLPPVLDTVHAAGIPRDDVLIVVGAGMHRASTPDELQRILGPEIASSYEVVNHDARDGSTLAHLTTTARGVEVQLNRRYLEADVRIVTGFVEPHIFAGYSGGGKAVIPGVAGTGIVMSNHGADMLGHPNATWCATDGNPIFEEMRDLALLSRPTFSVNVTLNERREITGVFAGELVAAHEAGIAQAEEQYVRPIDSLFDIVVSSNMGYPADLNLYQSVKGLSVAAQAVREGGAVILAAECRDGLGLAEYTELLTSEASPRALLERIHSPGFARYDQWGVQCQAMVQAKADAWLHSSMSRETTEAAHLHYCADVSATVEALRRRHRENHGRAATVAVLPHGHLTVPRLSSSR